MPEMMEKEIKQNKKEENSAAIPMFISKSRRQELFDLGYSSNDVDAMKPDAAHEIVTAGRTKPRQMGEKVSPMEPEVASATAVADEPAPEVLRETSPKKQSEHAAKVIRRAVEQGADVNEITSEHLEKAEGVFAKIPQLAKKITGFWRKRFFRESGVMLEKEAGGAVEEHLERVAANRPEDVATYEPALEAFEQLPKIIAEKEKEIDEKLKSLPDYHSLAERKRELEYEKNRLEKRGAGQLNAEELAKQKAQIEAMSDELADIEKNISSYEQADALSAAAHQTFNEYRESLFDALVPVQAMVSEVGDKAQARLNDLLHDGSLESLQKAQVYFEQLHMNKSGVDLLPDMRDPEQFQQDLDFRIAAAANTELDAQLEKVFVGLNGNPSGEGVYGELEQAIAPYLGLEKLGSKNAERTRKFFAKVLRNKIDELDKPEDEVKRALLKRVVAKHGLFESKVAFIKGKNGEGVWQKE